MNIAGDSSKPMQDIEIRKLMFLFSLTLVFPPPLSFLIEKQNMSYVTSSVLLCANHYWLTRIFFLHISDYFNSLEGI